MAPPSFAPAGQRAASATIVEIARVCGVSTASVSRALNRRSGVGAATRERILEVARELGYTPDSRARALVTGRVPFVALVLPDITNPFFPAVARGAEEELQAVGHSLLLINTGWRPERLRRSFELISGNHVGGLLMAVPLEGLGRDFSQWERFEGSIVMVGRAVPRGSRLNAVLVDNRYGGWLAGRQLCKAGWREIAYLGGPEKDRVSRERLGGLRRALDAPGAQGQLNEVVPGDWTLEGGQRRATALLQSRRPPDAIFAANDLIALGVARAAAEAGRGLGEDLGLVGYDDIDAVRFLETPITSVAQPKLEMGRRAARLLLSAIADGVREQRDRLRPELVVRRSCGASRGVRAAPGGAR
jgi:LacI family transcriptional regulator